MIQPLKKILVILFLLLLPEYVLAQGVLPFSGGATNISGTSVGLTNFQLGGITVTPSFTPLPTDLSVSYLGQIFGTVGTVLHGTSGQMLGQLFKVFNIGVLVIAGVFLIYTIIMTVINTAQEGEFMGRKWNSAWIAIRTVLGFGLLVPSATTGYSIIQVIVMWVVIQGAGFANMAWYSALGYLANGGQVYTPPATDVATMIDLVGDITQMQVCMYKAQAVEQTLQKNIQTAQQGAQTTTTGTAVPPTPGTNFVQNFQPLFTNIQGSDGKYYSVVKFPGSKYTTDGQQNNYCGQISFGSNSSLSDLQSDNRVNTLKAAVQQIILDTQNYAKDIVNQNVAGSTFSNQIQSAIVGGAADWVNITLPIRTSGASIGDAMMAGYFKTAVQEGWIMAGRYYYAIGNIQRQVNAATSVGVNIDNAPAGIVTPAKGSYFSFTAGSPKISVDNMTALTDFSNTDKTNLSNLMTTTSAFVQSSRSVANQVDQTNQVNLNIGGAGILGFLLDPVTSFLLTLIAQLTTAVGDPIIILQGFGYGFMGLAATMWLGGTIGVFGTGAASSILASANPLGYAVQDAIMSFIPTFTVFILIFFTMGATFAFYIPLIPFIIFVFAALGWIISVIEAMVAAPLVALGITHPEGHDLLGKSEQAIMLLLSVFLRPILMIIGLIAGMILIRVALRFLNAGFFGIVFDVGDFNLFAFVAVLVVYCMLIVTLVNQSFSLIYIIPDRVMRWLGVSEQTSTVQEALQAAKAGFEQIGGAGEKIGGKVGESVAARGEKRLRKKLAAEEQAGQNISAQQPRGRS